MTQFLNSTNPRPVATANPGFDVGDRFLTAIQEIAEDHDPTRSPFFRRLRELPDGLARDPDLLGQIHLVYQAAMHATRAAVYYLPHLDSPKMRKRKLQIFIDDDGLAGGDTHHYQLTRAFKNIGARLLLDDKDLRTRIANAARGLMEQRFAWKNVADQFAAICLDALDRRRARPGTARRND